MIKKSLLLIVALMLAFVLSGGLVATAAGSDTAWTKRIAGADRITTAIEVSQEMYPSTSVVGPRYVIIARSDSYADALAGAGLVTDVYVSPIPEFLIDEVSPLPPGDPVDIANPILLTPTNSLDDRVADEIERLATVGAGDVQGLSGAYSTENPGTDVYVLGGTGAISNSVLEDIEDLNGVGDVERIGGDNRYETAAMIDDEMEPGATYGHEVSHSELFDAEFDQFEDFSETFLATGENFPDALSAAGYAASKRRPILLSKKNELTDDTSDALDQGNVDNVVIVGGTGVISNGVRDDLLDFVDGADDIDRVGGDDRYETAVMFAEEIWGVDADSVGDGQRFAFARGDDFPDALAGSGLIGNFLTYNYTFNCEDGCGLPRMENFPTLLTNPSSLNSTTEDYLNDLFEDNGVSGPGNESFILGGTGALSQGTEEDIAEALSDGDFQSTDTKPSIVDSTVTIGPDGGAGCGGASIAAAVCDETVTVNVEVEDIENDDDSVGEVTLDTTVLGEDDGEEYAEDFKMTDITGAGADRSFENEITVETDDPSDGNDEHNVTLDIMASNQAGSDTDETDDFDIDN